MLGLALTAGWAATQTRGEQPPEPIYLARGDEAAGRVGTFAGHGGLCTYKVITPGSPPQAAKAFYEISYALPEADSFAGWYVDCLRGAGPVDASGLSGLKLFLRGAAGHERIRLGLKDAASDPDAEAILVDVPPLATGWREVEVPLASFAGLNKNEVVSFVMQPVAPQSGKVFFDSVRLSPRPAAPPAVATTPRTLRFAGRQWHCKQSTTPVGPGPNLFSDSEDSVWVVDQEGVDQESGVHLTVRYEEQTGKFLSSEIVAAEPTGFGEYRFVVSGPFAELDGQCCLGIFLYEASPTAGEREIDFLEICRWADPANPANAQHVVHPVVKGKPGLADTIFRFSTGDARELSVSCLWTPKRVYFRTWAGRQSAATPQKLLSAFTVEGDQVPAPPLAVRCNMWLVGGLPPLGGEGAEVVVKAFEFIPWSGEEQPVAESPKVEKPAVYVWVETGDRVHGYVTGIPREDCGRYAIKISARTDQLYRQPYVDSLHAISPRDLSFATWTRAWQEIVAELVERNTEKVIATGTYKPGDPKPARPRSGRS
ncbi:MAG: hypothetical protein ABIK89_04400 [Planctomycetota bacterium]